MNSTKEKLILFTRYPVGGKVKTRLIPKLGKEGAARLQELMAGLAVLKARCLAAASNASVEIRFEGTSKQNMRRWLGRGLEYNHQGDGNLDQRMNRAFEQAFKSGYERVVLIGCDCPQINVECLSRAFDTLKENDMAIGPAVDGGYYLIALRRPVPELFNKVKRPGKSAFEQTVAIARDEKLKVVQVQKLSDVDCPEDLVLCRDLGLIKSNYETISVVIAALNEATHIKRTASIASEGALEVIVADGGSQDNTAEAAQQAGASALTVPHGRACQLNTAALAAKGDILLFLHGDTELPQNFAESIIQAVRSLNFAGGAFRLRIDSKRLGVRCVEMTANLRCRMLKLPYGDQALFMTKDTFLRMGGFADMPIMEDYEFVKRLRRRGRVVTLDKQVRTSGRRWSQLGVLRTTIINQLMIAGYKVGISPEKLAGFYRNQKKKNLKINTERKDSQNESAILRAERP